MKDVGVKGREARNPHRGGAGEGSRLTRCVPAGTERIDCYDITVCQERKRVVAKVWRFATGLTGQQSGPAGRRRAGDSAGLRASRTGAPWAV